jgi:uncharacterized protein (TIGR02452 family)
MPLNYEQCYDGPEAAETAKKSLLIDRRRAEVIGRATLEILAQRGYVNDTGELVDLSTQMEAAGLARQSIPADAVLPDPAPPIHQECTVGVRNESTLAAARRLTERHRRVLVLNMANGAHPGGGWLGGARAQEEVLCRSSTLYPTIEHDPMYGEHRRRTDAESTHSAILSPLVTVFRDDAGHLLDRPWTIDVITCAAPVAYRVHQPRAGDLLGERIERILDIAAAHRYEALVLGAWGCGAFDNDGYRAAADFHRALKNRSGQFREVVFAITDWSEERRYLGPFRNEFVARP